MGWDTLLCYTVPYWTQETLSVSKKLRLNSKATSDRRTHPGVACTVTCHLEACAQDSWL
jgi:hypothetical protein